MPIIDLHRIVFFPIDFATEVRVWWQKYGGKDTDVTVFSDHHVRITVKPEELDKTEEIIREDGPSSAATIVLPIKEGRPVPLLINGKSWKLEQKIIKRLSMR